MRFGQKERLHLKAVCLVTWVVTARCLHSRSRPYQYRRLDHALFPIPNVDRGTSQFPSFQRLSVLFFPSLLVVSLTYYFAFI